MRVRLLFSAVCILILPIFLSSSASSKKINSAPFAAVAVAGHITPGGYYCVCGSRSDCICDPGEQNVMTAPPKATRDAYTATLDKEFTNGINPSAGVMLLTLALLLGLRMRL